MDFSSVGPIHCPSDCDKFVASQYSKITILTGATCDAIWSFTCFLLFYLRLRKITQLIKKHAKLERKETEEMLKGIEPTSPSTPETQHTRIASSSTTQQVPSDAHLYTEDQNSMMTLM
eukprot:341254_1